MFVGCGGGSSNEGAASSAVPGSTAASSTRAAATSSGVPAPESLLEEANRLFDQGDYDGAIAKFTEVIRLDPSNVDAFNNRGNAHFQLEDLDACIHLGLGQ